MKKLKKDLKILKILKHCILKVIEGQELAPHTEDIIILVCQILDKGAYLPPKALERVCDFTIPKLWSHYESQMIKEGETA